MGTVQAFVHLLVHSTAAIAGALSGCCSGFYTAAGSCCRAAAAPAACTCYRRHHFLHAATCYLLLRPATCLKAGILPAAGKRLDRLPSISRLSLLHSILYSRPACCCHARLIVDPGRKSVEGGGTPVHLLVGYLPATMEGGCMPLLLPPATVSFAGASAVLEGILFCCGTTCTCLQGLILFGCRPFFDRLPPATTTTGGRATCRHLHRLPLASVAVQMYSILYSILLMESIFYLAHALFLFCFSVFAATPPTGRLEI